MNTDHDLLDRLQAFVKAESKDWFNVGTGQLDHTEVSPAGKLVKEALDRLPQYQPVERVAQAIRAVNSDTEGLSYTELTTAMAMAAIAAMRASPVLEDNQGCENCSKEFPIEAMTMMGDYWFCQGCYDEWKAEFDACNHHWTPQESEFGEPGEYCDKCSGFHLLADVGGVAK